jgi:hypothetical protein
MDLRVKMPQNLHISFISMAYTHFEVRIENKTT